LPGAANASLRAQEWGGDLVFLHEVKPGPADKSYGVQVAKLAGLPPAAVRRAEAVLRRLEAKAAGRDAVEALPLFADLGRPAQQGLAEPSEVERLVADVDPEALTPRQALDLVFQLKALLRD
jgi:DNA mismatch repair protein MutS